MSTERKPTNAEVLDAFCQMFRAVARPAVTVIFAAVIAQAVIQGVEVPQWFLALAIPIISWWFAERTIQHAKDKEQ
jgi:hypothetical protein